LDKEEQVLKNQVITIMVRFTSGDEFFCGTYLGYGGNNRASIQENEKDAFDVRESADCSKGETDQEFGQISRLFYF